MLSACVRALSHCARRCWLSAVRLLPSSVVTMAVVKSCTAVVSRAVCAVRVRLMAATCGKSICSSGLISSAIFAQKCDKEAGRKSIKKWYAKVGEFDNKAFNDIAAAMYDREDEILNYFVNRSTNASAESLNAKIKDFRAQLRGVIDKKFFIFRLVKIFG